MEFDVILKPHLGRMNTPIGVQSVEFDQWMVEVNGTLVGFLGKRPGSSINFIRHIPEPAASEIRKAINNKANLEWPSAHQIGSSMVPQEEPEYMSEDDDE